AEADVHHVVVGPPSAEWPAGVVSSQRTEALLLSQRCWRNGEIDASNIGHEEPQQIHTRSGWHFKTEDAVENTAGEERCTDELGELLIVLRQAAIPVILHG